MKAARRPSEPSLAWSLTLRLAVTMLLAMLLQAGMVAVRDYLNETDFLNSYVKRETVRLASIVGEGQSAGTALTEALPRQYTGAHAEAYAFRVVEADGRVVAEHNAFRIAQLAAWTDRPSQRQDFWVRRLESSERMHVAGGLKIKQAGRTIWVEIATFGDPAGTYLNNLARDVLNDVWAPALPLVLLSMVVVGFSVRRSLEPLVKAATRADEISVLERGERLDASHLPAEASHFALAINRLLDRVTDLVSAQRLFIARAAHELRTPLSIMMLELANLKESDSKRFENDLAEMSQTVERLLALSRMETLSEPPMQRVDFAMITRDVVARMQGLASKKGHTIELTSRFDGSVLGDEASLREAIRNLIENAVRHTPSGTRIVVAISEDGSIVVEDNGPGLGALSAEELQQPFRKGSESSTGAGLGLSIVRQAVELHGGTLEIGSSALGGARFVVRLPASRLVAGGVNA